MGALSASRGLSATFSVSCRGVGGWEGREGEWERKWDGLGVARYPSLARGERKGGREGERVRVARYPSAGGCRQDLGALGLGLGFRV